VPPVLDAHELDDDKAFGVGPNYEVDTLYEREEMRKHESIVQEHTHPDKNPKMMTSITAEAPAGRRQPVMFPSVEAGMSSIINDQLTEDSPPPAPVGRFDDEFLAKAASGYGSTTTLDVLQKELEQLQRQIYERNHGVEFNLNSPAKVSRVLFGPGGGSTEKSVLEAKAAGGDHMADLILQYRSLKQRINRLQRKRDDERSGRHVSNPSAVVARTSPAAAAATGGSKKDDFGSDPLMLVDASSYIFRAYYSMPPIHRAVDGMPTGAVLGFCNMLNKLALNKMLNGETPRLVLVFDPPGKTFRHTIYRDYKSHRPEAPVDLIPQFALVRQAAKAYGICQIEAPGFEADDVIATLCRMARDEGLDVNIFSGDKDLMQLVTDRDDDNHHQRGRHNTEGGVGVARGGGTVQMIDPATMTRYTSADVFEKWGVSPSQLGDVLALAGDTADNVPGTYSRTPVGVFDS
jgi:DNA polymerase-1